MMIDDVDRSHLDDNVDRDHSKARTATMEAYKDIVRFTACFAMQCNTI